MAWARAKHRALRGAMLFALAVASLRATLSIAAIPDSEREALIALYESTHGGTWGLNTNWCTTSPCPLESPTFAPPGSECYTGEPGEGWYGVECNRDRTHVVAINLSANHLTGSLPSIAALTALQTFQVGNNELVGALPDLSALTALHTFAAPANHLSGPIPSLDGLAALEAFLVGDNQLTGLLPRFDGLYALRAFDARANQLSGPLPELRDHTALVNFVVTGNALTGSIPDLSGLDGLRYFYVDRNRLTGTIPPLAALGALRQLSVAENRLTGVIPALPSNVNQVDFGTNQLSGTVPSAPAALWSSRSNLCPNPLDVAPSGNDAAWNVATGHTPWWADPADGVVCDDLFMAGFDAH